MTENKREQWTPGPWRVEARGEQGHYITGSDTYKSVVCEAREYPGEEQAESYANAHLIAAAPDLLAAAREALGGGMPGGRDDALCHRGITTRAECVQCRRVDGLRAAIAKAEGK